MNEPRVVVRLDAELHRAVQALLPWHAAQALDAADRERVETHLADCARCQADLAFERRLQAAHAALGSDAGHDVERGLARLDTRLDAPRRESLATRMHAAARAWRQGWQALGIGLRGVLVAQSALIGALGLALALTLPFTGSFRTLGSPRTAAPGNLLLMLSADASAAQLRAAVEAGGARIVDGPTAAGAWVLAVPPERRAAALQALRAQPMVTLAEPLADGGVP